MRFTIIDTDQPAEDALWEARDYVAAKVFQDMLSYDGDVFTDRVNIHALYLLEEVRDEMQRGLHENVRSAEMIEGFLDRLIDEAGSDRFAYDGKFSMLRTLELVSTMGKVRAL